MSTVLQPKLDDEPDFQAMDDLAMNDLFQSVMEEIEEMSAGTSQLGAVRLSWTPSPVGPLLLGVQEQSLRLLHFCNPARLMEQLVRLQQQMQKPLRAREHRLLDQAEGELQEYFAGERREFSVPLKATGTAFQEKVWRALRRIPYGETWSYEQLAGEIGQPTASRAVGLANGANPLAIVIPCHRVVNKSGQIGGYGGGLRRKQLLLQLEQQAAG